MRPTVSFCGFPTYQLSKYLTTILQPLTEKSRRNLQSTEDFINASKTVEIPDDYEQKLWCRTLKKAPFRLAVKQYRSGYAALTILSPPYDTTELTHSTTTLDKSSYNPTSHKATSLRTLTRRAQLVCNTTDSLSDENKYLENNYNEDFIQCNTHRPATTTEANDNATPSTTATIPYTKGISENISHILQPFNNCVAHKPYTILRQLLTHVKDKDDPRNRKGAVYKISCFDCPVSYIGETGKTSQLDWLSTNERRGNAMSTITLLNITDLRTTLLTGTLHNA